MPTERPADSPEVLARFESELDPVDLLARQVGRTVSFSVTLDDLRSFGREGLLRAAQTFDESRGVPFRRWANLRVRGAIIDGLRQWGHLPRRMYRDLRAAEDADSVLEQCDEEDSGRPATSADAADARLTQYMAGMATAMAMGMVASSSEESAGADDRALSPEELVGNAELVDRIPRNPSDVARKGATSRREALLRRQDSRRGRGFSRLVEILGGAAFTRAPSRR